MILNKFEFIVYQESFNELDKKCKILMKQQILHVAIYYVLIYLDYITYIWIEYNLWQTKRF